MLYDSRRSGVSKIEKQAGIKFEHVSAPQPNDIAKAVGMEAAEKITQVCDRYGCFFTNGHIDLVNSEETTWKCHGTYPRICHNAVWFLRLWRLPRTC